MTSEVRRLYKADGDPNRARVYLELLKIKNSEAASASRCVVFDVALAAISYRAIREDHGGDAQAWVLRLRREEERQASQPPTRTAV